MLPAYTFVRVRVYCVCVCMCVLCVCVGGSVCDVCVGCVCVCVCLGREQTRQFCGHILISRETSLNAEKILCTNLYKLINFMYSGASSAEGSILLFFWGGGYCLQPFRMK